MAEHLLVSIVAIIVLGVGANWLAWRLHLPSILLLLLAGFLAGPIFGFIQPNEMLGDLLFPIVSLSVALILYEGGLTLDFRELRQVGGVVLKLITLGVMVTWAVGTVAAYYLLDFDFSLALLLSAVLVVTGPTVVGPLLQQIRPKGEVGSTLKWEGILIDPIGALLAVLVFEVIVEGEIHQAPALIVQGVLVKIAIGTAVGLLAAGLLLLLLRRFWVPDRLENGVSMLVVLSAFAISNLLHEESGLLAATIMGIALANQKWVDIKHIVEFKENLRVILIASLFILLAARLEMTQLAQMGPATLLFLAVLVLVARPLSVLVATIGSALSWKERVFMSWMAPRGIVAAAVASIFALRLVENGYTEAGQLVPETFMIIVGTVLLYGLTAKPLANWLDVADADPEGVLIMGAHRFGRMVAEALQEAGFTTRLIDSNWHHVTKARMMGLDAHYGNALTVETLEDLDLNGIGRFLALTSNDEANALAALHFSEVFGRSEVYQLPIVKEQYQDAHQSSPLHLRGRILFGEDYDYKTLAQCLDDGRIIKKTKLTAAFDLEDFKRTNNSATTVGLFIVDSSGGLHTFTTDFNYEPSAGDMLVTLTTPPQTHEASQPPAAAVAQMDEQVVKRTLPT